MFYIHTQNYFRTHKWPDLKEDIYIQTKSRKGKGKAVRNGQGGVPQSFPSDDRDRFLAPKFYLFHLSILIFYLHMYICKFE